MRTTNAFSGKSFGRATLEQKVRERWRRTLMEVLRRILAPFILVARPFVWLATQIGILFGQISGFLAKSGALVRKTGGKLALVTGQIWRPINKFAVGGLYAIGRVLRPILIGLRIAPSLAVKELRQLATAFGTVGREVTRLTKLSISNTVELAVLVQRESSRTSASLARRAAADWLVIRVKALGLVHRTRLFLVETATTLRKGGQLLARFLTASGQLMTQGLRSGAINLARDFVDFWVRPLKLARRIGVWLPVAGAAIADAAKRAGAAIWQLLATTGRAVASLLLIAGFVILFVVTIFSRGIWTVVRASALGSIWVAVISVRIGWWTLRSLGLAAAYLVSLAGRLIGRVLSSAIGSLAAAYAALPGVLRAILQPIVQAIAAVKVLFAQAARGLAAMAKRASQLALLLGRNVAGFAERLWDRLRAFRVPRWRLQPRGEEALAYGAVGALSLALLMFSNALERLPAPIPSAEPEKTATEETVAPAETSAEPQVAEVVPNETAGPELSEPPAPEPKMAYAKPPAVESPLLKTPVIETPAPKSIPAPLVMPSGTAKIAIVIDDMGMKRGMTRPFAELPGRLTFAFLPYAGDLQRQTRRVREAGHELLVHLPMEPQSRIEDPGPNALLTRLSEEDLVGRIKWNLNRFEGFAGINNHMGSLFTQSSEHMRPVIEAMRNRHLVYLDSKTAPTNVGRTLAEELGVPWVTRDIFLDNVRTRTAIDQQLARTIRIAERRGQAVAIGHNYQVTLDALRDWLPEIESAGFQLVTISELIYGTPSDAATQRAAAAGAGQ